jgi:hypothetical protein
MDLQFFPFLKGVGFDGWMMALWSLVEDVCHGDGANGSVAFCLMYNFTAWMVQLLVSRACSDE